MVCQTGAGKHSYEIKNVYLQSVLTCFGITVPSECINGHLIITCSVVFLFFSGQYLNKSKRIGLEKCFFMALYNLFGAVLYFRAVDLRWNDVLCVQEAETLVKTVLPSDRHDAAPEIAVYLKESVGNSTRIDYGTGLCLWIYVFIVIAFLIYLCMYVSPWLSLNRNVTFMY